MSAIDAGARAPENLWRQEIRATLALAWPMVLTNLGQTAMTATDVMMMGRLGPDTLASGALGANLYFMPLIFGLGLMLGLYIPPYLVGWYRQAAAMLGN